MTRARLSKSLPPTHGAKVCKWIEAFLVHGEGDKFGEPFRLEPFQRAFIYRLYEYDAATGARITRRALLGLPKGNGKTELLAAIGLAELAGPTAPTSPNIPVGAASYEQANLLFGTAATMLREGPLAEFFEIYEDRILIRGKPGKMYRVAAEAGTNDGTRPTCFIADEVHEWVGRKERVHLVISNSLAKRENSLALNISTAGFDKESLLYHLYDYGRRVEAGEIDDPTYLFIWYEASRRWNLENDDELREAILECNPAADKFWPAENLMRRYKEIQSKNEFRRYHLNQWTDSDEAWFTDEQISATARDGKQHPDGAEVVLSLDGSHNGDSTALTAASPDHVQTVQVWEKPKDGGEDWKVPVGDVEETIRQACKRWRVVEVTADPYRWQRTLDVLESEGLPVTEFPQSPARMVPACSRFYEAMTNGMVTHDAHPAFVRHLRNAVLKVDSRGARIVKDTKSSIRKIDLAVSAVMGFDRACQREEDVPPPMIF